MMGLGKLQNRVSLYTISIILIWCKFGKIKLVHKSLLLCSSCCFSTSFIYSVQILSAVKAQTVFLIIYLVSVWHTTESKPFSDPKSKSQFCLWFVCCIIKALTFHPFKNSKLHFLNITVIESFINFFFYYYYDCCWKT